MPAPMSAAAAVAKPAFASAAALGASAAAATAPTAAESAAAAPSTAIQLPAHPASAVAALPNPAVKPAVSPATGHLGPTAGSSPNAQKATSAPAGAPSRPAGIASACGGCASPISPAQPSLTALGSKWHVACWKCAGCHQPIQGSFNTEESTNRAYHPACYREAFGKRCVVCNQTFDGTYVTVKGKPCHTHCFTCSACGKAVEGSYQDSNEHPGFYHPHCYEQAFGERCSICNNTFDGKYTVVEGKPLHYSCFRCTACSQPIDKSYKNDDEHPGFYHPHCYKEAFGDRCAACHKTFEGTYHTVTGKHFHHECFRCIACSLPINKSYKSDDKHPGFYHPHCYKEAFGERCTVCHKTCEGTYTTVAGKPFHYDCIRCAACGKTVQGSINQEGGSFYHPACHREKFDPRCSVCTELLPLVGIACLASACLRAECKLLAC